MKFASPSWSASKTTSKVPFAKSALKLDKYVDVIKCVILSIWPASLSFTSDRAFLLFLYCSKNVFRVFLPETTLSLRECLFLFSVHFKLRHSGASKTAPFFSYSADPCSFGSPEFQAWRVYRAFTIARWWVGQVLHGVYFSAYCLHLSFSFKPVQASTSIQTVSSLLDDFFSYKTV